MSTPSFYSTDEIFQKYLGNTSYYLKLQEIVQKIIKFTSPVAVLELGCSLGHTSIKLAKEFKDITFRGYDVRENIIEDANILAQGVQNVGFCVGDMSDKVKCGLSGYDLIFMLYSFHHIKDPFDNKEQFLKDIYSNMKRGANLLILETFLPDTVLISKEIMDLFGLRSEEAYASTFWNSLDSLSTQDISLSRKFAEFAKSEEKRAGNNVVNRDEEYLVKFSWLVEEACKCGFKCVLAEPVNCIMEKAVLFRK